MRKRCIIKKLLTNVEDRRDKVRYHLSISYQHYYDGHNIEKKCPCFLILVDK